MIQTHSPEHHGNNSLPLGLYIHVPFCRAKCGYCAFYSVAGNNELSIARYLHALRQEIALWSQAGALASHRFSTIFLGGGTPTMITPERLVELLQLTKKVFQLVDEPEISLEANPATIDYRGLRSLRQGGFNRISIGVQSLDDGKLRALGRAHDATQSMDTVRNAQRAGFSNVSMDLMYGLPGQTPQSWRDTLLRALALEPQHLSIYELTPEEGTPLAKQLATNFYQLPHEDEVLEMMAITVQECAERGIKRYEISNYALPGFECEHNRNYWRGHPYLGLGPGAVSRLGLRRSATKADLDGYCRALEQNTPVEAEEEILDTEILFREAVILGLRMLSGVCVSQLRHRFGIDPLTYYGETLSELNRHKFLRLHNDHLQLTALGLPIANTIMARLV